MEKAGGEDVNRSPRLQAVFDRNRQTYLDDIEEMFLSLRLVKRQFGAMAERLRERERECLSCRAAVASLLADACVGDLSELRAILPEDPSPLTRAKKGKRNKLLAALPDAPARLAAAEEAQDRLRSLEAEWLMSYEELSAVVDGVARAEASAASARARLAEANQG
jgi:hypothetical protein